MPPGTFNGFFRLVSATPDLEHVLLETPAVLTPGATYGGVNFLLNWYEWTNGQLEAVNIPPGAEKGETISAGGSFHGHVISEDGSRVIWAGRVPGNEPFLYLRENIGRPQSPYGPAPRYECLVPTDACTVEVDESQHGTGPNDVGGNFWAASADDSRSSSPMVNG